MIRTIFIAFVLSAAAAQAQDIPVRSGEHDGYTRLVAQVPPGTGWVLVQSENGAHLNVELDKVTFNTGSVFRRLTQNRLAAVSQSEPGGALEMQFGCDCVASAFLFKNTMIVVDIAPGKALPPIRAEIAPPVLPKAPKEKSPLAEVQELQGLELPLLSLTAQRFEDQLSTLLLRGADRELVDLNLAPVGPRMSVPEDGPSIPPGLNTNIHVTSVLDGLNDLLGPSLPQLEKRPPCISNAELGFDRWSGGGSFPEQVASLRGDLFQEFDRIDKEKALELARLYAHSGFGAEALQALDLLGQKPPEADRVAAIARFLDGRKLTVSNPFTSLQRCESDAALWALLIEGVLQKNAQLRSIEQSFARLPDHLRRHVGPTLAEILTDAGKLEAARRVLRAVDRIESVVSTDTSQAKAKVAAAEGDGPRVESLLNEVINSSDADMEAPLALARLVDKRWSERGSISPQELDLAAAYVVEFRRSDLGPLMWRTQIVALSLSHEFDEAVDLLVPHPSEVESIETLNRVAQILTERADDETFLRRALTFSTSQRQDLTTETAVKLAERFVTLGFAEAALDLAGRPQDKTRRAERARLRARAALLQTRPHQAMLELADDPSDTAQLLRGQAMQAIGDYASAGELWRAAGEDEDADRFFWLADRIEEIDDDRGTKYSAVNRTTMYLSDAPGRVPDKPLADAHNLLADSSETRRRISELLAAVSQ